MKVAVCVTCAVVLLLFTVGFSKGELDSDEYEQTNDNEVESGEEQDDQGSSTDDDDDTAEDDQDSDEQDYRVARGLFKKKKKSKVKIKIGGGDSEESEEKCSSNDDCKFYKYCNGQKICVNKLGRRKRQWLDFSY